MSSRNHKSAHGQAGFTITELVITITMIGIVATTFYTAFQSSLVSYSNLQKDATSFTDVAAQTQRIASVLRGSTDIRAAGANDMTVYAYFFPSDEYPSEVRYYLSPDQKKLLADVVPFTDNPPIGVPDEEKLRTVTIVENFKKVASKPLFQYFSIGTADQLALPITNLNTIKIVRVNLAAPTSNDKEHVMSLEVSLRNRKTNL